MAVLNRNLIHHDDKPVRIMQFGASDLIRGSVDYFLEVMMEEAHLDSLMAIVTNTRKYPGNQLFKQDGLYTVIRQGDKEQEKIINIYENLLDCADNYPEFLHFSENPYLNLIISEEDVSYDPKEKAIKRDSGKFVNRLLGFLLHRYEFFAGNTNGLYIMTINQDAIVLKDNLIKLAKDSELNEEFVHWISSNRFITTKVDSLAISCNKMEIKEFLAKRGYRDNCMVKTQQTDSWIIYGDKEILDYLPIYETRDALNIEIESLQQ